MNYMNYIWYCTYCLITQICNDDSCKQYETLKNTNIAHKPNLYFKNVTSKLHCIYGLKNGYGIGPLSAYFIWKTKGHKQIAGQAFYCELWCLRNGNGVPSSIFIPSSDVNFISQDVHKVNT